MMAHKLCDNDRMISAAPQFIAQHGASENVLDLIRIPWVCLPWQRRFGLADAKGRKRNVSVAPHMLVSNSDLLTEAALQRLGLAVKSRMAIRKELDAEELVKVLPGALSDARAPTWFVFSPEARTSRKTKAFGDMVSAIFK